RERGDLLAGVRHVGGGGEDGAPRGLDLGRGFQGAARGGHGLRRRNGLGGRLRLRHGSRRGLGLDGERGGQLSTRGLRGGGLFGAARALGGRSVEHVADFEQVAGGRALGCGGGLRVGLDRGAVGGEL